MGGGRRESEDTKMRSDNTPMSDEDEETIRAKLRESGWEKKNRKGSSTKPGANETDTSSSSLTNGKAKGDEYETKKKDRHDNDDGDGDRNDDDRKDSDRHRDTGRKSSRSDGRSSRSHRSRSRRRDRDRRSSRNSSRRSSKLSSSSRRRSSRSRSRSPSESRSRSRSVSVTKSSSKRSSSSRKRRASVSKSRSRSMSKDKKQRKKEELKQEEEADKNAKQEQSEEKSKTNKDEQQQRRDGDDDSKAHRSKDKNDDDEEETDKKDKDSHRKSSRKSSRRSSPRSRSRSSRRRRHRSRSRSLSVSRSRRRRGSSRSRSRSRDSRRSHRDRDRDRDRRRRGRSRSRSPSYSYSRSSRRRRSASKDKQQRRDANSSPEPHDHPPAAAPGPVDPTASVVNPTITQLMQQYPTMSLQDIIAKMQASNVTMAAAVAMKPARELYVGNLPPNVTAPQLQEFLGTIIQQVGLSIQPGNPILNTWISTDGHFAFCEMRSVEECNLALLLNQLSLLGQPLKFGRPRSFMGPPQPMPVVSSRTQTALVNLGCTPNPAWFASPSLGSASTGVGAALASSTLGMAAGGVGTVGNVATSMSASALLGSQLAADALSNRLIMMNIPVVLEEEQVTELVQPFGELKSFSLVKDSVTGASTGSALFEYKDDSVAEEAMKGLNGLDIGGIALTVRRAPRDAVIPGALPPAVPAAKVDETSAVVKMANMVTIEELKDDEEYDDLAEDVEEECKRFGTVVAMEIPRPKDGEEVPGVGSIFVRFQNTLEASASLKALSGRKFGGKIVQVTFYPVDKFERKDFN